MLKLSLSDIQLISFNTYNHIIQSCYGKKFKQQTKKRSNNNVIGKINYYSAAKRNQSVEKNKRNTKNNLFVTSKSETTNSPIHEFTVLQNSFKAFKMKK